MKTKIYPEYLGLDLSGNEADLAALVRPIKDRNYLVYEAVFKDIVDRKKADFYIGVIEVYFDVVDPETLAWYRNQRKIEVAKKVVEALSYQSGDFE